MNLKLSVFIGAVLLPFVAACTPDQINSAIEACQGNPECYQIIDSAIEEELEARGITGGKMTNLELREVTNFLKGFTYGDDSYSMNHYKNTYNYWVLYALDNGAYDLWNAYAPALDKFNGLNSDSVDPRYIKLDDLGLIDKQLVYIQENPLTQYKILIYKTGNQAFTYELYLDKYFEIKIDLNLKSLFLEGMRYSSPNELYNTFKANNKLVELYENALTFSTSFGIEKVKINEVQNGIYIKYESIWENSNLKSMGYISFYSSNTNQSYSAGFTHGIYSWNTMDSTLYEQVILFINKSTHESIAQVETISISYKEKISSEPYPVINNLNNVYEIIENNLQSDNLNFTSNQSEITNFIQESKTIFSPILFEELKLIYPTN